MKKKFTDLTDTQLALIAQGGDVSAFEEIYTRHAPGIARSLASFAGPEREALDDLVQDVFVRVIERLSMYTPSHPFPNWLYTIALNIGRNHVRSPSRISPMDPSELDAIARYPNPRYDQSADTIAAEAMRMVSLLPDSLREIVALRIGSDLAYSEIGEILGIPEGTARGRMHSAMCMIRKKLELIPREKMKGYAGKDERK